MSNSQPQQEPTISTQIIELMRGSVITQAVVTVMALGATPYILADARVVPGELWAIVGLTLGFYFGGKVHSGAARLFDKHVAKIGAPAEAIRSRHSDDGAGGVGLCLAVARGPGQGVRETRNSNGCAR